MHLEYLEHQLPDYPFEPGVDTPFVEELVADFGDVHILDEIKMFRWYSRSLALPTTRCTVGVSDLSSRQHLDNVAPSEWSSPLT